MPTMRRGRTARPTTVPGMLHDLVSPDEGRRSEAVRLIHSRCKETSPEDMTSMRAILEDHWPVAARERRRLVKALVRTVRKGSDLARDVAAVALAAEAWLGIEALVELITDKDPETVGKAAIGLSSLDYLPGPFVGEVYEALTRRPNELTHPHLVTALGASDSKEADRVLVWLIDRTPPCEFAVRALARLRLRAATGDYVQPWLPENAPRLTRSQMRDLVLRAAGCVAIAPRRLAEWIDQINTALYCSTTWGEFRDRMPHAEYEDVLERSDRRVPRPERPFDAFQIPGAGDGDYPYWLASQTNFWIPRDVLERHGEYASSVLNGPFWNIDECQAQPIARTLRKMRFSVEQRRDLEFS